MSSTSDSDTANLDSVIVRACGKLGYCDVRPSQHTAIKCFLQVKDVFICLPTGSGKSLQRMERPSVSVRVYQKVLIELLSYSIIVPAAIHFNLRM